MARRTARVAIAAMVTSTLVTASLAAVPGMAMADDSGSPSPSRSGATTQWGASADGHTWSDALAHPTVTPTGGWASYPKRPSGKAAQRPAGVGSTKPATPFVPKSVNQTVVGGAPHGDWAPAAEPASGKGSTSAAPSATLAAAGSTSAPTATLASGPAATLASGVPSAAFTGSGAFGPGLGLQDFYGLETFDLSERLTASVNLANGNLIVRSRDVALGAPGLSVRVDQFFNTLSSGSGAVGLHGSLSTGQDIGLMINTGTVTFYGPSGFTAAFTADGAGGWTAPAGINADLTHHGDGTWSLIYHKTGEKLTFSSGGYLTGDADRNGIGLSLAYTAGNELASITDAAGRVTTLSWNGQGNLTKITDPVGREVAYTYYANGMAKTITYPDGAVVNVDNSQTGGLDGIQTPGGYWVHFTYDSSGRLTRVDRFPDHGTPTGDPAITSFDYPTASKTTETNPLGDTTSYTLDSHGRVTKVVDPLGHTRSASWTSNSDVATTTDAMGGGTTPGNTVTYSYDTINNLVAVALPTGAAARAAYATSATCAADTGTAYQVHCSTDPAGHTKAYSYDTAGNLTAVEDTTASGSGGTGATPLSYTYQSATSSGAHCGGKPGQVCSSADGNGKTTTYAYDSDGNLVTVTPPSPLGATHYGYDAAGRVTSVTDGKGKTTSYGYDAGDHLIEITLPSGGTITNYFDEDGDLIESDDSGAGDSYYDYDAFGQQTWRQQPNMHGNSLATDYDLAGQITATEDIYGEVRYDYNDAGQLTSLTEPSGTSTVTTTFGYDANGNEISRALPNGITQTTTRDADGRPTRIKATVYGETISDLGYSYTTPGGSGSSADRAMVQTRTDHIGIAAPAGATTTYGYDGLNRLASATEKTSAGATNASWAYTYDAAGNRTAVTTAGATGPGTSPSTPAATSTWDYNAAGQITSDSGGHTWGYDANGNQTAGEFGTAGYDEYDALTSLTPAGPSSPTSFDYIGTGNTQRQAHNGTTEIAGILGMAATFECGCNNDGIAYRHTLDGAPFSVELPDGTNRWYLTDALGSVVALTATDHTTANYAYTPYGATRAKDGEDADDSPFRYTGGYTDADSAGLYHLGARYYDPSTGRFTQQDPRGQQVNPYLYAGANPINYIDPNGQSLKSAIFGAAAGVVADLVCEAVTAGTATPACVAAGAVVAVAADVAYETYLED